MLKNKDEKVKRLAVLLEYDGSTFSGWQVQVNSHTVQAELEKAIWKAFREHRRVQGTSRTDAGVHARGQVAAFDLAYPLPAPRLVMALNKIMPPMVRVIKAWPVRLGWDPQRTAISKTYTYLIYNRPIYSPLRAGRAWQIFQSLDMEAMLRAAKCLVGQHDFSSFQATGGAAEDAVRRLTAITITRQSKLVKIKITGTGFVYRMVRNIIGTLVEVGKGRMKTTEVKKILMACNRKLAGPTAPAYGLYLEKIKFAD
ncbi:tRNA pseudouridine(38-40) synthase TruA [bacterium]|nr:tRNA pseudouridine(38-40) synthase TruA [bacterium]